jgi:hypothetical protein
MKPMNLATAIPRFARNAAMIAFLLPLADMTPPRRPLRTAHDGPMVS